MFELTDAWFEVLQTFPVECLTIRDTTCQQTEMNKIEAVLFKPPILICEVYAIPQIEIGECASRVLADEAFQVDTDDFCFGILGADELSPEGGTEANIEDSKLRVVLGVPEIGNAPSLLLQWAVIVFVTGLVDFLW